MCSSSTGRQGGPGRVVRCPGRPGWLPITYVCSISLVRILHFAFLALSSLRTTAPRRAAPLATLHNIQVTKHLVAANALQASNAFYFRVILIAVGEVKQGREESRLGISSNNSTITSITANRKSTVCVYRYIPLRNFRDSSLGVIYPLLPQLVESED